MNDPVVVDRSDFEALFEALKARNFQTVGPTVREGAIVYDTLGSASELPAGIEDEQEPGRYRLHGTSGAALFGYTSGVQSWKRFLHPPEIELYTVTQVGGALEAAAAKAEGASPPLAFVGVRPCELQAIAALDRVLLEQENPDPFYKSRREGVFIVAVNCTQAGGTCFCTSMQSGPKASSGFDLVLTEIFEGARHAFLTEPGSPRGADLLRSLPHRTARCEEAAAAEKLVSRAAERMGRTLEVGNLQALLYENTEHPQWEQVAKRCLTCGNCTLVCPTCFCTTVTDTVSLSGDHASRRRSWDSCFSLDFSYIHGGSVRSSARARYRHWVTHKFATWVEQFATPGCVGCGRCITWCPAGIDITTEIRSII